MELQFSELGYRRPLAWGYFRQDSYQEANGDCQRLWIDYLVDHLNPQPIYFPTSLFENNEASIPEITWAKVDSLSVLDKRGMVVGQYRPSTSNASERADHPTEIPDPKNLEPKPTGDNQQSLGPANIKDVSEPNPDTKDVQILEYLRGMAPAVVQRFSLQDLYREYPDTMGSNQVRNADGSLEIMWGDNLVQQHVMLISQSGQVDQVVMYRMRCIRGSRSNAEKEALAPNSFFGEPSNSPLTAEEVDEGVLQYHYWSFKEYRIRTGIIRGSTVDGVPSYHSEVMVSDNQALEAILRRAQR